MNYIFKAPSLQQIAEVKIVSELWNQEVILIEIAKINFPSTYPFNEDHGNWKAIAIEEKLKNKITKTVSACQLPKLLQENLVSLISPLSLEVRSWWFSHKDLVLKMPYKLVWTSQGTIDNRKTAELIVQDENSDLETRYKMACTYCFEKEMPILWKRIPIARKEIFYNFNDKNGSKDYDPRIFRKDLVAFWTYFINDKLTELHELMQKKPNFVSYPYLYAFELATYGFNWSASEFFFERLSSKQKDLYLEHVAILLLHRGPFYSCKMETVLFLLNQMNEEQQEIVFKKQIFDVFVYMLEWPHQTFFIKTAKKWFHFLFDVDLRINRCRYSYSFNKICDKIKHDERDYNYKKLFLEFWQLASVKDDNFFQKDYILLNLIELYEAKEVELVQYILNRATNFQKQQLIYIKGCEHNNLPLLIDFKKLDFLMFLMSKCITCKEMIINFESYVALQHSTEKNAESKNKLIKAHLLIVDFIQTWK